VGKYPKNAAEIFDACLFRRYGAVLPAQTKRKAFMLPAVIERLTLLHMYGCSNVITCDYEILFLLVLELRHLSVSLRRRFWLLIISVPGKQLYNSVHR